ncbi:MAG: TIGR02996 domain-containing protein [Planctomycetes bacterium]|nr:TIGR02996 domain-containing protein [Planctomycetota bacterium]
MATERELLKAVLAKPDDDKPRLAYADWCDARKDPRGEFIRLQLKAAKLGRRNGAPYRVEATALASKNRTRWARGVIMYVDELEFHRGFVEHVETSAERFLDSAERLFQSAPIRHLKLSGSSTTLQQLFHSPHLASIRSLALPYCKLEDRDLEVLSSSPSLAQLRWLSLYQNNIDQSGVEALATSKNLPNLRYVDLDDNPFNPCEQFSHDMGYIADSWLPPEGEELEKRHGRIEWLHRQASTTDDLPPDRFTM